MFVSAVKSKLAEQPFITSRLGRYVFGDDGEGPCIFTRDPAPVDAPNPVIVLRQDGGVSDNVRDFRGSEIEVAVTLWGDKSGSERGLRRLAIDIWRTLDRGTFAIEDYDFCGAQATPPRGLTDDEGFPGFTFTVTIRVQELEATS